MTTAKLYFVVRIFLFFCILRTLGKEMGSSVVGFGYPIVANLASLVHVRWCGLVLNEHIKISII